MRTKGNSLPLEPVTRTFAFWTTTNRLPVECRERFADSGPWLFGRFSIADAMYAPVVSRFRTYGVALDGAETAYLQHVLADADVSRWLAAAAGEPEFIAAEELGR